MCILYYYSRIVNDLEQKEKTISTLQEQVKQLNKQLQIKTDAINSVGESPHFNNRCVCTV